jgi:hypothetical protein
MSQSSPAPFLSDPITVSRKELIEHYRAQAARYKQLAEREHRSWVSQGLLYHPWFFREMIGIAWLLAHSLVSEPNSDG